MKGKKLLIFPCGKKEIAYIKYAIDSGLYQKVFPIVPKGLSGEHWDIGCLDKRGKCNIKYYCDLEKYFDECDDIWIPKGNYDFFIKKQIQECIAKGLKKGKRIFNEEKYDEAETVQLNIRQREWEAVDLYQPNATVIFVGECFEDFHGIDIILQLTYLIRIMGFRVETVIDRKIGELLEICTIPNIIKNKEISGEEKIIMWNKYLRNVDERKSPDIILVQVPGGMLQTQKREWDNFGLRAYYLFKAVSPDIVFATFPCNFLDMKYIKEIQMEWTVLYGVTIDKLYLSNRSVNLFLLRKGEGLGNDYVEKLDYEQILEEMDLVMNRPWDKDNLYIALKEIVNEYIKPKYELIQIQL